jgi:hypothetical protein
MILDPDKVEGLVYVVTFIGGGWITWIRLEKKILDERIKKMEDMGAAQWRRVDDFRAVQAAFVTKAEHEAAIKGVEDAVGSAINRLTDSLTTAINHLTDRIDRFAGAK